MAAAIRAAAGSATALLALLAAAPATPTVTSILSSMAANTNGLTSYQVPVTLDAKLKKGISVPVHLTGTRYFKAPDKDALKFDSVPSIAEGFQNIYGSLGTPQTWPQTYNITLVGTSSDNGIPVYQLRGTYKKPSNVDHVLLDVSTQTYDPVRAQWFYKNGATVNMQIVEEPVGKYRLPETETLDVNFPEYSASANVAYGKYAVNQPIPDSTFAK